MQETWVRSLGREDHLEKEMAAHSSLLAWEIPWIKEPGGLQYMGSQRVGHDWVTNNNLTLACKVLLDLIPASISSLPTPYPLASWTTILALAVLWRCYFSPAPGPVHSCSPSREAMLSPFAPSTPTLYHKVGQPLPTPFFFKKIIYLFDYFRSLLRHSGSSFLRSAQLFCAL